MNTMEITAVLTFILGMLFGLLMGALSNHTPHTTRRITLRALKHYQNAPDISDPTVQSILRRQIRRLEHDLRVDEDQD